VETITDAVETFLAGVARRCASIAFMAMSAIR